MGGVSQPMPPPGAQVHVRVEPPTSGLCVGALMLGVVGVMTACCSFGLPSLAAIICGHAGLRDVGGQWRRGHNLAIAGLVLGYAVVGPAAVVSFWLLVGNGVEVLRELANQSAAP
jgi:hypothetical protein